MDASGLHRRDSSLRARDWSPGLRVHHGLDVRSRDRRPDRFERDRASTPHGLKLRRASPRRTRPPVRPGRPRLVSTRLQRCVALYHAEGVDLEYEPRVGVGSIASRQGTPQVQEILSSLASCGLRLLGFGLKNRGLAECLKLVSSADSAAWSLGARYDEPLAGCRHRRCSSCSEYATRWRDALLERAFVRNADWHGEPGAPGRYCARRAFDGDTSGVGVPNVQKFVGGNEPLSRD